MAYAGGSRNMRDGSQVTQGSNDTGRTKSAKTDKTHRIWSVREEEILRLALKELVALSWKSDNGFRTGYLNKLEDALRREFPKTDLKVHPHIVSKLTAWKKNYYSLQGILNRSGVGFNLKGDYMIDCDNDQWEQIVKIDSNARFMRNKSWPYLEDWKEIFGKDRATGENAEDILDALNNIENQEMIGIMGAGGQGIANLADAIPNEHMDDDTANAVEEDSVCQIGKDGTIHQRGNRKRKHDDGMEGIFNLLHKIHSDTSTRLQSMSTRITHEEKLSNARKALFEILDRIPGLTLDEKFEVSEILATQNARLDLFMGIPDAARPAYVARVLKEKRKK